MTSLGGVAVLLLALLPCVYCLRVRYHARQKRWATQQRQAADDWYIAAVDRALDTDYRDLVRPSPLDWAAAQPRVAQVYASEPDSPGARRRCEFGADLSTPGVSRRPLPSLQATPTVANAHDADMVDGGGGDDDDAEFYFYDLVEDDGESHDEDSGLAVDAVDDLGGASGDEDMGTAEAFLESQALSQLTLQRMAGIEAHRSPDQRRRLHAQFSTPPFMWDSEDISYMWAATPHANAPSHQPGAIASTSEHILPALAEGTTDAGSPSARHGLAPLATNAPPASATATSQLAPASAGAPYVGAGMSSMPMTTEAPSAPGDCEAPAFDPAYLSGPMYDKRTYARRAVRHGPARTMGLAAELAAEPGIGGLAASVDAAGASSVARASAPVMGNPASLARARSAGAGAAAGSVRRSFSPPPCSSDAAMMPTQPNEARPECTEANGLPSDEAMSPGAALAGGSEEAPSVNDAHARFEEIFSEVPRRGDASPLWVNRASLARARKKEGQLSI